MKQLSIVLLGMFLIIFNPNTNAQIGRAALGKVLKGKKKNEALNKDKLPGQYYTSSAGLATDQSGGISSEDFYMQDGENGAKMLYFAQGRAKGLPVMKLSFIEKLNQYIGSADMVIFGLYDSPYMRIGEKAEDLRRLDRARVLCVDQEVYLFYGEREDGRYATSETYSHIADKNNLGFFMVIAKSKEKIAEWTEEKVIEKIFEAEQKIKAGRVQGKLALAKDTRMPKAGKMHNNKELLDEITVMLKNKCAQDGSTLKRVVITANDWEVVKNKVTGEILYRHIWGYMADSKASRSSECMVFGFYFTQKYDGTKFLEGSPKLDCCSQDAKYGPYILCENIDK
jgi:hypothetical protein